LVCRRVIAIFGFIQFIEGNFLTPKITGSKVSLNSFASILAIICFRCYGNSEWS
jgi:predicted PurR-regulated permease PerM